MGDFFENLSDFFDISAQRPEGVKDLYEIPAGLKRMNLPAHVTGATDPGLRSWSSPHKPDQHGISHALDISLASVPVQSVKVGNKTLTGEAAQKQFVADVANVLGKSNIYVDIHNGYTKKGGWSPEGRHIHMQAGNRLKKSDASSNGDTAEAERRIVASLITAGHSPEEAQGALLRLKDKDEASIKLGLLSLGPVKFFSSLGDDMAKKFGFTKEDDEVTRAGKMAGLLSKYAGLDEPTQEDFKRFAAGHDKALKRLDSNDTSLPGVVDKDVAFYQAVMGRTGIDIGKSDGLLGDETAKVADALRKEFPDVSSLDLGKEILTKTRFKALADAHAYAMASDEERKGMTAPDQLVSMAYQANLVARGYKQVGAIDGKLGGNSRKGALAMQTALQGTGEKLAPPQVAEKILTDDTAKNIAANVKLPAGASPQVIAASEPHPVPPKPIPGVKGKGSETQLAQGPAPRSGKLPAPAVRTVHPAPAAPAPRELTAAPAGDGALSNLNSPRYGLMSKLYSNSYFRDHMETKKDFHKYVKVMNGEVRVGDAKNGVSHEELKEFQHNLQVMGIAGPLRNGTIAPVLEDGKVGSQMHTLARAIRASTIVFQADIGIEGRSKDGKLGPKTVDQAVAKKGEPSRAASPAPVGG